jgi:hypothetical protein
LGIQRSRLLDGRCWSWSSVDITLSTDALDDRNELYPARIEFIAQKTVDGAAMLLVGGVNRAKDVEFDAMLAQVPPTLQHA